MSAPRLTISEDAWQKVVLDYAALTGWRRAHFRPARTERGWRTPVEADGAGFPDLVLVRQPELLIVELKAERGRLSPAQSSWLADLQACADAAEPWLHREDAPGGGNPRLEVHVWRPSDWPEVERRLRRPA